MESLGFSVAHSKATRSPRWRSARCIFLHAEFRRCRRTARCIYTAAHIQKRDCTVLLKGRDVLIIKADYQEPLIVVPLSLAAKIAAAAGGAP